MRATAIRLLALLVALPAAAQQTQTDPQIDDTIRASVVGRLTSKIQAGYVIPEAAQVAIRNLRAAQESGEYKEVPTAKAFAARLTSDLRSATKDIRFLKEHASLIAGEPVAGPSPQLLHAFDSPDSGR
jgi:hypothetical protein